MHDTQNVFKKSDEDTTIAQKKTKDLIENFLNTNDCATNACKKCKEKNELNR